MDTLVGRSLGRYDITEKIGEGGMGVVFRAHDTRLDRDVAVKVLNEAAVANSTRIERFKREARAVARLSHPNIMEIHDFGAQDNIIFAVMELLEGIDLRQHMKHGRLGVRDSIDIARQVAEGLEAAHSEGVVHRDIKPENIFLTHDDRVKILDFGLAHLRGPLETDAPKSQTTLSLTDVGTVLGTPRYMSPEQVRGQEINCSSDIFSLGCVLYEMVTGKHPFLGKTKADTMAAILHKEPEPLGSIRPNVSTALDDIVLRCLEKKPRDRFHSAHDLGCALQAIGDTRSWSGRAVKRRVLITSRHLLAAAIGAVVMTAAMLGVGQLRRLSAPPPVLPEILHLGIVPFTVAGASPEDRSMADGLAADIARRISLLEPQSGGRFWVVEPERTLGNSLKTCQSIRRRFNVSVCLGGTFERQGDVVSLTLEVTDAASGTLIGSEVIESPLTNVRAFQIEPTLAAAHLLSLGLEDEVAEVFENSPTNLPKAFVSKLHGTGLLISRADPDTTALAIGFLEEAVAADPMFAEAWIALGDGYRRRFIETGDRTWLDRGFKAARQAITWRKSAAAYRGLSALHSANKDGVQAIAALEEAIRIDPDGAESYQKLGKALEQEGRLHETIKALEHAIYLRPGYWVYSHDLALIHYLRGDYVSAAIHWRRVTELAPLYDGGYANLGIACYYFGNPVAAKANFERAIELNPDSNENIYLNLGTLYYDEARFADAAAMFETALELNDSFYVTWGNLGFSLDLSIQPERATAAFTRAVELVEEELKNQPDDPELLSDLASYHAELGNEEQSRECLEQAIDLRPTDPLVLATIAETYEVLGDRDQALLWIEHAFESGDLLPDRFDNRPTLRSLVNDPRYQALKTGTNQRAESDEKL